MPATVEITESLIRDHINRAIKDVFKTMLGREPSFCAQADHVKGEPLLTSEPHRPQVVGTVGFIGECNGLIYLHLDLAFAKICTCHLLGMTEAELRRLGRRGDQRRDRRADQHDGRQLQERALRRGLPLQAHHPSILRGTNFSIEPISSAVRHVYFFDCAQHRVVADILMKSDD